MKKMIKKIICVAMVMVVMLSLVACGSENNQSGAQTDTVVSADTIGGKYVIAFNSCEETDPNAVVDELMANVEVPYSLAKMDVEPGYLNGFDEEIKGFEEGVMFAPMIGSIPFVGYVLKTSDAAALVSELKGVANMRWNVCTEADEQVDAIKGDFQK